jgi:hypothetical protein
MKHLATLIFISLISIAASWIQAEPSPAIVATTNVSTTNAAATTIVFEFYDSYICPKTLVLFSEYKSSLRHGQFDEAASILALIYSLITTDEERTQFLQKVIPDSQQQVLEICQICPDCETGNCLACNGKGICTLCQGKKYCLNCKGKKSFSKPCEACLCQRCRDNGVCHTCLGSQVIKCPSCKGTGMAGVKRCSQCKGVGYINCSECGGKGKCPVCSGRGRISNCSQCDGAGYVVKPCTVCHGTGQCPSCQNSGVCQVCKGSGICPRCNRNGIITCYNFPVSTDWVRVPPGAILHREHPVITNQMLKGTGSVNITSGQRDLNLNIQTNEILCISETERVDWIKSHVLQ